MPESEREKNERIVSQLREAFSQQTSKLTPEVEPAVVLTLPHPEEPKA